MITTTSPRGRAFTRGHEGIVLTCYLDSVDVPTIGTGFTMRSAAVRRALAKIRITKLVPGKTKITMAQCDAIFAEVLAAEFEPAVVKNSPADRSQQQMDAATSAIFNLGTGAMGWRWAEAWRRGDVSGAASILGSNYNTAKGRRLPGLVRRRKEEAALFLHGDYGDHRLTKPEGVQRTEQATQPSGPDEVVREVQGLLVKAGFDPGKVDGWMGAKTTAAVLAFQKAHPHLKADGIIGPATIAQLRREAAVAGEATTKSVAGGVAAGGAALATGLPWGWIAAGAAVAVLGVLVFVAWRKRDVIARRFNTWSGREAVV
ncbi:peptidoglycan-binding protein [Rhizobium sp. AAP43]|uniref:glycoside hydrolase family protein n=1 Tax=Rhizobium sp. AAP43 TaxID=1523420 RepID=UPI0006B9EEDF|nr:peptidoglycan-binding protein [Rhizobium sp. AAP43]KPF47060.1 peptidoglycan-binding protein [Rhizobium sp. AAP43]